MLKDRLNRIIEIKEKMMDDKEREIEEEKSKARKLINEINRAVDTDIEENYERIYTKVMQGNDFSVIRDYMNILRIRNVRSSEKEKQCRTR